jgi:hypothetical protein
MSARIPMERGELPFRRVPTTPVPPRPRVTAMPHSASFLEAQFRMRVEVTADLLDFGAELNHAVDELHDGFRRRRQEGDPS